MSKPPTNTFKQELRDETYRFLAEIVGYYGVSPKTHLKPKKTLRMILTDHDASILSLVEGLIPPESNYNVAHALRAGTYKRGEDSYHAGWNACIADLRKQIRE